ncbi:MAG: hypothetical protein ACLQMO_14165 [Acidobacteriaceae bacterium]
MRSNGCPHTQPPVVQGEMRMQGTRNPAPMGSPWTNSSGVPDGADGGGLLKKPALRQGPLYVGRHESLGGGDGNAGGTAQT